MKPRSPIHADARSREGRSRAADKRAPSFPRSDMEANKKKKTTEKPSETAINDGVVAVGAVRR